MSTRRGKFAKIYAAMWDGTLYGQWEAWSLFVFMLANCGPDGVLDVTPAAISARSGMPLDAVMKGISVLEAPDPGSRSPDEAGARVILLDAHRNWGWRIVNFKKYREFTEDPRLVSERQKRSRVRRKASRSVTGDSHGSHGGSHGPSREAEAEEQEQAEEQDSRPASQDSYATTAFVSKDSLLDESFELGQSPAEFAFKLPLRDGTMFPLSVAYVAKLERAYGGGVWNELERAGVWLESNPGKGKTKAGMARFVNAWMARAFSNAVVMPQPKPSEPYDEYSDPENWRNHPVRFDDPPRPPAAPLPPWEPYDLVNGKIVPRANGKAP